MQTAVQSDRHKDVMIVAIIGGMVIVAVLWAGGVVSATMTGHSRPRHHPFGGLAAFAHMGEPSLGWHAPVGGPFIYWAIEFVFLLALVAVGVAGWRVFRPNNDRLQVDDPTRVIGLADRRQVAAAAGPAMLLRRAGTLRPSLARPEPRDVGFFLGRSRGVECWMGIRDSMVLVGPPGSGKGLHFVIPTILDAPGAVINTSSRPDNLTATIAARSEVGPVAVFDPQGLAGGVRSSIRWSPVRGCQVPQTAMIRARALCAEAGKGTTDGNFWAQQTTVATRCLLHAAAIGGFDAAKVYRWSLSPAIAKEAVQVLADSPAAPAWDKALDSIVNAEQRQRDSIWAMVSNAFAALGDPQVLDAVLPGEGESFDPVSFLRRKGTLYLLGTATGASDTATLVAALVEDVVEVARRLAASSVGARLDPPLALVLDEASNYPLPSLGQLMSEGGGTGIPTIAVLQSLAQARDKWGKETGDAIWDSATCKVVLGGLSNADDLADISRLIGEREHTDRSTSRQWGGELSVSESLRREAILDPAQIRAIKCGYGLLLMASARPVMLTLRPWVDRSDASTVRQQRAGVEEDIRRHAATWHA